MIGFICGSIVTAIIIYYALKVYKYFKKIFKTKKQAPTIYYIDGKELVERKVKKPRAKSRRGHASVRR